MADTPTNQVRLAYEKALKTLLGLLAKVETDNRQKVKLQERINEARAQYQYYRSILYPKHFKPQPAA